MLSPADLARLARLGLDAEEVERQLERLREPPRALRLIRPATIGDGIEVLAASDEEEDLAWFERARAALTLARFVPASGAASRMFRDWPAGGDRAPELLSRWRTHLSQLPFQHDVARARRGDEERPGALSEDALAGLLDRLVHHPERGLANRPKALLPFHRYGALERTPFEEHLREWAALVAPASPARAHFTVAPAHRQAAEALLARMGPEVERESGVELRVSFSAQEPSTDTLAIDADGEVVRDADGAVSLRPGGHGALLGNLSAIAADLVHLRNVDNVARREDQGERVRLGRRLLGRLARLRTEMHELRERLQRGDASALEAAEHTVTRHLGRELGPAGGDRRARLVSLLERPLRVCGMVRNLGEPGGGPFWVEDADGQVSLQIVEASQIDRDDAGQGAILAAATHFNPVDLCCALTAADGRRFELERFVDHRTWFTASKTQQGAAIRVLERPGLWNGAMAGWATMFVEIPASAFTPVKTVWDLLRPAHQDAQPG